MSSLIPLIDYLGCFPLCQRFRNFRLEFKWKSPFRFLLTGIFGPPLEVVHLFRSEYSDRNLSLTNRVFALIRELRRETNSGKSHSYWLARFNRKMSFHFARKFPPISDRSVSHNGKHPVLQRLISTNHRGYEVSTRDLKMDIYCADWLRNIFNCYLLSENADDGDPMAVSYPEASFSLTSGFPTEL